MLGIFWLCRGTADKPDYNGNSKLWNSFPLQAGSDSQLLEFYKPVSYSFFTNATNFIKYKLIPCPKFSDHTIFAQNPLFPRIDKPLPRSHIVLFMSSFPHFLLHRTITTIQLFVSYFRLRFMRVIQFDFHHS